jgi:glycosyltransferase involved in cell wall biosynthesis
MKIAIEAQRIFRKNKHGMDFVALEILREIQHIDTENDFFVFVKPGDDHCLQESCNMHIIEVKCPTYPLWEQIALPIAISKVKPDLLHCTSNTAPLFCSVPLLLTLHDIIFLESRQSNNSSLYQNIGWYYRRYIVPRILPHCKKIITVSNFECNNIKQKCELSQEKLITVYNSYSERFSPQENFNLITTKYINAEKYIFFLGNTDPKKNVPRTLKAYSIYRKKSLNPKPLLLADLDEHILLAILKEQHIEEIRVYISCPGYVHNTELPFIYSGASVFLYTSLRESFGIPILEAMACGTPVIVGNTSAMPEIAGEGGMLVDPTNENEIADKILALENDTVLYNKQVMYGLERVKNFSWRKTSKKILKIYADIVNDLNKK